MNPMTMPLFKAVSSLGFMGMIVSVATVAGALGAVFENMLPILMTTHDLTSKMRKMVTIGTQSQQGGIALVFTAVEKIARIDRVRFVPSYRPA